MNIYLKGSLVSRVVAWICGALFGTLAVPFSGATLLGPTPYLSFANSPFFGGAFSYFYLENFEDHLLNTPGVTGNGTVTSVAGFSGTIIDSVFADGNCPQASAPNPCDSYFGNGAVGIQGSRA